MGTKTTTVICTRCLGQSPQTAAECGLCGATLSLYGVPERDEVRVGTVLFADVADFTRVSSGLPLPELKVLMDRVFEALYEIVVKNGGVVDKYIGDCLMALFSVPAPHPEHAAAAVRAGLAMQQVLADDGTLTKELLGLKLPLVKLRVGINSGAMWAGRIGAGPQGRFTVIGDTVNVAAHLQQGAAVGSVVLGPGAYRQVRGLFELEQQEARHGPCYLVRAERVEGRWLQPRKVLGRRPPIIGRDAQLGQLRELFAEVVAGGGAQLALVVGGQGVGKTRLAFELTAESLEEEQAVRRLFAQVHPVDHGRPLAALVDLINRESERWAGQPAATGNGEHTRLWLADLLGELNHSDQETLDALVSSHGENIPLRGQPELMLQRSLDLADRILDKLIIAPSLLVAEDLHLWDTFSLQLLGFLLRRQTDRPLLILGLARPDFLDENPAFVKKSRVTVELGGLDDGRVKDLLTDALGARPPTGLANLVVAETAGIPHQVEELVRSLSDSGVLARRIDGFEVGQLPLETRGLARAAQVRMEILDVSQQQLLARAALIGRRFWRGALRALGCSEGTLDVLLATLVAREVIAERGESRFLGEREFTFLSEATLAAARACLAVPEAPLHLHLAEWLLQRVKGRPSVLMAAGRHLVAAEKPLEAAETLGRGGDVAAGDGSYQQAASAYGEALDLLASPTLDDSAKRHRFSLLSRREKVLNALGRWRDQLADAEAMLAHAEAEADEQQLVESLLRVGRGQLNMGEHEAANASFARAHDLAAGHRDSAAQARALRWQAMVHFQRGELRQAVPLFERALRRAPEGGLAAELTYELAVTVGTVGDYERALTVSHQALSMFRQQQNRYQEAFCRGNIGCFHIYLGELDAACTQLEEAAELGRTLQAPLAEASARANLGYAFLRKGDPVRALELAEQAGTVASMIGDLRLVLDARVYQALSLLALGEVDRAASAAWDVLERGEGAGIGHAVAAAKMVLARCRVPPRNDEMPLAEQAVSDLEALGAVEGFDLEIMRVGIEHHLGLGQQDDARRLAERAAKELDRRAGWISDEDRREHFLRIDEHRQIKTLHQRLNQ